MAAIRIMSKEELAKRRESILGDLGLTEAELRAKVESGGLVGKEWTGWAELEDLDYLLDA